MPRSPKVCPRNRVQYSWNTPLHVSGVPLMLLIRTYSQSLKTWR